MQIVDIIMSMMMHRLEKLVVSIMVLILKMMVLRIDFCESIMSLTFLLVAWFLVVDLQSMRHLFLWGRKADGSIFLVSCLRLVTFLVAKLP